MNLNMKIHWSINCTSHNRCARCSLQLTIFSNLQCIFNILSYEFINRTVFIDYIIEKPTKIQSTLNCFNPVFSVLQMLLPFRSVFNCLFVVFVLMHEIKVKTCIYFRLIEYSIFCLHPIQVNK